MIIDAFIFYNELELLEVRLYELFDVVDYFILVEGTQTFTGLNKKLYFEENKNKFEKYLSKIIHIISNDFPITNNPWDRERYQRNCIDIGLKKLNLCNNDIIIISDVDEIIDSNIIKKINNHEININDNLLYSLEMTLYYYTIEYTVHRKWYHVKLLKYHKYKEYNSPENVRMSMHNDVICNSGWHISYYGDTNFIINKLESFSEQQDNIPKYKNNDFLNHCIHNGTLFFNNEQLIKVTHENNKNLPKLLLKNN